MTTKFKVLALVAPVSLLAVACGSNLQKVSSSSDLEELALELADENQEIVADHVEDVATELALEDSEAAISEVSLGLAKDKSSSLEKSCSISGQILTLKRERSAESTKGRQTRAGEIEKNHELNFSFERSYEAAAGSPLPFECKTEKGPVKLIKDKLSALAGLKVSAKNSRSRSTATQKKGETVASRASESTSEKTMQFSAPVLQDKKVIISKSMTLKTESTIKSLHKGEEKTQSHSSITLEESPLKIKVERDAESLKLISKTIESGHVRISRESGKLVDVIYENVVLASDCKPSTGHIQVVRTNPEDKSVNNLSITFRAGEAFVSKNGAEEKKMDSLNVRLEGCSKK